jgi:cytochrome P450
VALIVDAFFAGLQRRPFTLRNALRVLHSMNGPVLSMGGDTFVVGAAQVREVFRRPMDFTSGPIYAPRLKLGPLLIGLDPSERYANERHILETVLQPLAVSFGKAVAQRAFATASTLAGPIDLVTDYVEPVFAQALCDTFGFDLSKPPFAESPSLSAEPGLRTIVQWQRKLGGLFATDAPAPFGLDTLTQPLSENMSEFLRGQINAAKPGTLLHELCHTRMMGLEWTASTVGGMLLAGATLFKAATLAIHELTARSSPDKYHPGRGERFHEGLIAACVQANKGSIESIRGYVWEALRFRPPFPFLIRYCPRPTKIAGRAVLAGSQVVVSPMAAMFDPASVERPEDFIPSRLAYEPPRPAPSEHSGDAPQRVSGPPASTNAALVHTPRTGSGSDPYATIERPRTYLLFGTGPHECVAESLVEQGLPQLVASFLLSAEIKKPGRVKYDGPAVAGYRVKVEHIGISTHANVVNVPRRAGEGSKPSGTGETTKGAAE